MKKLLKKYNKKKVIIASIAMIFVGLYACLIAYTSSDSYLNQLDESTNSIEINDSTGEITQNNESVVGNKLVWISYIEVAIPILGAVAGVSIFAVLANSAIVKSISQKRPKSNKRLLSLILPLAGMIIVGLYTASIWHTLNPPQCESGSPEGCIVGASFGGLYLIPATVIFLSLVITFMFVLFKKDAQKVTR